MNYQRIYCQIIFRAQLRGEPDCYFEKHHIIPRSLGGGNAKSNIVKLTAREHYLAHWLLYKIHRTSSMATAWYFMRTHSTGERYTSHTFKYARIAHAKSITGRKLSAEHKKKIALGGIGRTGTEAQKKAAAKSNAARKWTKESRRKASKAKKGVYTLGNHPRARKVTNMLTGEVFECMTDAASSVNVTKAAIQNSITNSRKCKGVEWRYE